MTTVIPANPGFFLVYEGGDGLIIGEPVIGWKISAEECSPLFCSSEQLNELASNFVGYLWPDGRCEVSAITYDSIKAANESRSKERG
jgi:hypothetical protein